MACYHKMLINLAVAALVGLLTTTTSSFAEEHDAGGIDVHSAPGADAETEADDVVADNSKIQDVPTLHSSLSAGYRFLSVDGHGGRAAEFEYLHSSPTFGLNLNRLGNDLKYSLDGSYLNEKDYSGDFSIDYRGEYRLLLRTESLFHNLDRLLLFSPGFGSYSAVADPPFQYGIRVEQDSAEFRYKIHDVPVHFNLGYWRMLREGTQQLIFADQAFEGTPNTIYAIPRPVDRQIHEGSFGADAHAGPLNFVYLFKIRQFEDHVAIPTDLFTGRPDLAGNPVTLGGVQQHNEDPESRLISHTIKVHTSLSGGIVGAASYSYATRDNLSRLSDVRGARGASTTVQNAAGDFVYTPCKEFSLALKYRLQQVDNDSPPVIVTTFTEPRETSVRPSIDTLRHVVTATASFRPTTRSSIIGEYEGTLLHRSDLGSTADQRFQWRDLPEDSETHRGTLTFISRPVKGLRLKALYSYITTDNPSYGASAAEKHEGKVLVSYNSSSRWGATVGYHGMRENNDLIGRHVLDQQFTFIPYSFPLSRERAENKISSSFWISPAKHITISGSYSYLRSNVDQGVLLTSFAPAVSDAATYTSQAHIYSVGSSYHVSDDVDLSLLFQQVRSHSEFEPQFVVASSGDTAGIREISQTSTVENSLSARSDFRITGNLSLLLDYSFREYRDKVISAFDGTVHAVMVQLHGAW